MVLFVLFKDGTRVGQFVRAAIIKKKHSRPLNSAGLNCTGSPVGMFLIHDCDFLYTEGWHELLYIFDCMGGWYPKPIIQGSTVLEKAQA